MEAKNIHTHDLVVSLRSFIREALDLAPIPNQDPTRSASSGGMVRGDESGRGGSGPRQSGANGGLAAGVAGAGLG